MGRLSHPEPDRLDQTYRVSGTDLLQVARTKAERLPGFEVSTGAPQPGVVAAEQEGVLLLGHMLKISFILPSESALKVNIAYCCRWFYINPILP